MTSETDNHLPYSESDRFSRFILQKGDYSGEKNAVKPNAFNPPRTSSELSVFWTEGMAEIEVWKTASEHIDNPPDRITKARGDFKAAVVAAAGLQLRFDNSLPRHANIVGWPPEKHARMLFAKKLADSSVLVIRPMA